MGFNGGPGRKYAEVTGNALVLMARGIANNWKQSVAY